MRYYFLIFTLLIFGQTCFAQKLIDNFFVELGLTNKTQITRDYNLHPTIETNYFEINQRKYVSSGSIYINANLGYKLKNGNQVILGIGQDAILNSYDATVPSVNSFTPSLSTSTGMMRGYGGVACTNISLFYQNLIINSSPKSFKNNTSLKIYYNVGLSYFYKPNNGIENLTGSYGQTFTAPDSNKVSVIFTNYNLPVQVKNSFKLNTGFTFSFNKNNKETFALTISYITNRMTASHANFLFTKVETTVTDNSGGKTISNSIAYFKSAGNGIYFTLSKKIFPFKIIHDRQQKKLDKFKSERNPPIIRTGCKYTKSNLFS